MVALVLGSSVSATLRQSTTKGKPQNFEDCASPDEDIIYVHGWGYPGTSGDAEARNRGNPEVESCVLANAQTGLRRGERARETRPTAEGNHGRVTVDDRVEENLAPTAKHGKAQTASAQMARDRP